jgi:hypothetical protein
MNPTRQLTLQSVAAEAGGKAMTLPKPLGCKRLLQREPASKQAVIRMNIEQVPNPGTAGNVQSVPNEWYKWTADLRTNRDIKISGLDRSSQLSLGGGAQAA